MRELIAHSARLVVMTERGRAILQEVYHAPAAKIDLIPHGIPDVTFFAPDSYKDQFGVGGKKVLLTFGLLSPNKGIEHVLHALPEIVAEFPDAVYIVLGATHPNELRTRGEAYRLSLEAIVRENKLENNVIFHNRFVELKELTEFIGAADLYITPYLDEAQITSGTLAYAFGAGKAVISTPYWHAAELLKDQRGVLVPFADPTAIAREVSGLLRDGPRRKAMSDEAYRLGRAMVWSKTAALYHALLRSCAPAASDARCPAPMAPAPAARIAGVESGSSLPYDRFDGHFPARDLHNAESRGRLLHGRQRARPHSGGVARPVGRSLPSASVRLPQPTPRSCATRSTRKRSASTISSAEIAAGWMSRGPKIAMAARSGRWAPRWAARRIGLCRRWPNRLFEQALPAVAAFTSPRAWAFSLIGLHEYLRHRRP